MQKWSMTDFDFFKSCVFTEDSGFNINMRSSTAGVPRGKETIVERLFGKDTLALNYRMHCTNWCNKCKHQGTSKSSQIKKSIRWQKKEKKTTVPPKKYPKDTTTDHYTRFNSKTFDSINKREDTIELYLIADNTLIHTSKEIEAMIKERGRNYKYVYPPPNIHQGSIQSSNFRY